MKEPRSIREVQQLAGRLAALNRFISRAVDRGFPFFKILRNTKIFLWTNECSWAFMELKSYLEKSPLVSKPEDGERMWIYLALSNEATNMVLARESKGTHLPVYYTSRLLQNAEVRYNELEKLVLALLRMARKLRPYFLAHPLTVLIDKPLKHALQQGTGSHMTKWSYELNEFDIEYQPRKAIKAQALADFIAECPQHEVTTEEVWDLFIDGSVAEKRAGGGEVLKNSANNELKFAIRFEEPLSNNEAEYEALLCGLEIAKENEVRRIKVHCDSQLVVEQVSGGYEAKDDRMRKLMQKARNLFSTFQNWELVQISRNLNNLADTLARMGSRVDNINNPQVTLLLKASGKNGDEVARIEAHKTESWMDAIRNYLEYDKLPTETLEAHRIKRLSARFFIEGGHLFKKSFTLPSLRCLTPEEAWKVMQEIHEGCCGNNAGGRSLAQKGRRIKEWCTQWKIKQIFTSVGNPKANGQTEVINRILIQNLKTKLEASRTGWVEEIPGVLWAYRTTSSTSTGETPFSLVYESEALIPAEVVEPTKRVISYEEQDNHEARRQDLDLVEEQRDLARIRMENYKRRILRSYNSRVKERTLQIGDLVLRKVKVQKSVGKLEPKWEGPYRVIEIRREGTYKLATMEGLEVPRTWSIQKLKRFYP
ncbi:UNVERIFIED_CONTAM: hypothetical protein Sradi_3014800 [Sesamum radiatum]|uniref:Uncharacterized protein n=1 Tax=Sesamum radiatum TaxID=300843 RepID=A0AAW2S277_SESRA